MNRTSPVYNLNEPLIFEQSSPGKAAYSLPPLDVEDTPIEEILDPGLTRQEVKGFPEVSEVEIIRHYTRMSTWNYHIDLGMYPLGSCTMKYNPRLNERTARMPRIAMVHPMQEAALSQGNLELIHRLQECLQELTGLDAVTLQPAAGSQGEMVGILMVRAHHEAQERQRRYVLIPDSAHGTNPASAAIAGYQVVSIPSDSSGRIDIRTLRERMNEDVACLMLTNPNTLGIFESEIEEISRIVHDQGGLIYMDGANFNALMGYARPGDMGIDVLHLNLHKTFSTPHGGGGPGCGAVACRDLLTPYLPSPVIERDGRGYRTDSDRPHSIGPVHAFHGNFGMMVRALTYILTCGGSGLKQLTETAVLNANYIRARLQDYFHLPYPTPSMHEAVFSDKTLEPFGVKTLDVAKQLIDEGFHPPTIYFPLIVRGAMMIEPTESESKAELDAFVDAMVRIYHRAREDADAAHEAPRLAKRTRLDETRAARRPVLRWSPGEEA